MRYLIVALIGYLFGCLQWSYILGLLIAKKDIRTLGMKNPGASNTVTVFGWRMGVLVGVLDILKAILSILLVKYLFKDYNMFLLYLNGTAVIMGHNYPFFMGFRGGKGTASTVGMLFGLDYRLGLLAVLIVLLVALISDYIIIGTMALVSFLVLATLYLNYDKLSLTLAILIAGQSFYKHLINFKRIKSGQEIGIRQALGIRKK